MPHDWATSAKQVNKQFTCLNLVGNVRACTSNVTGVDLNVIGDALFQNDICITSNIHGYLIGNVCGNVKGDITSNNYSTFNGTLDLTNATIIGFSGSGEINNGVNLGNGSNVFASKSGVNLQFRSLVAGNNISIIENANTIVFDINSNITGNLIGNIIGNVFGDVCGNITTDFIFDKSGSGVNIDNVLINDGSVIVSNTFSGDLLGGNITGNLFGNLTGDICGNITTDFITDKSGSGINIENVTINNGLITGNLDGNIVGAIKFRILNPLGGNISGEDVAPLATYASEQKSIGLPVFLHDPNDNEFQFQGLSGSGNDYNDIEWYGINNPILRMNTVSLNTGGINGCSIRVMGNTFVTILGDDGSSNPINKLFDIPSILNDPFTTATGTPSSRSITFSNGDFRVGQIKANTLTFDTYLTNNARVNLSKLTKVNRISIGTGCRLNINNVTKDTTDTEIYLGEQSFSSTTDSHLEIDERNSSTIDLEIRGTRSTAKVNNISTITFKNTSTDSLVIGQDNDIVIESGATNSFIFGLQNSISDSGTNSEFILHPAFLVGVSFTGFSVGGSATIKLRKNGNKATVHIDEITGTSNAVVFVSPVGTIPSVYRPTGFDVTVPCIVTDSGMDIIGSVSFKTTGEIEFYAGIPSTSFTAAGTKGSKAFSASWII